METPKRVEKIEILYEPSLSCVERRFKKLLTTVKPPITNFRIMKKLLLIPFIVLISCIEPMKKMKKPFIIINKNVNYRDNE